MWKKCLFTGLVGLENLYSVAIQTRQEKWNGAALAMTTNWASEPICPRICQFETDYVLGKDFDIEKTGMTWDDLYPNMSLDIMKLPKSEQLEVDVSP